MTNRTCWIIIGIIFIIKILITHAKAASVEFGYNLLTIHTFARSHNFEHKLDSQGVMMNNPITFIKINNLAIMWGRDSVNSKITGAVYFFPINKYVDVFAGAYSHSLYDWRQAELANVFAFKIEDRSFIPALGVNLHYTLFKIEDIEFNINNLTTPATNNTFLSIKKEF